MRTLICEGFRVSQQQKVDISSLVQKYFPYRSPHERILRNPFLVGVLLINTECGTQDISLHVHAWRPSQGHARTVSLAYPLQLSGISLPSSSPKLSPSTQSRRLPTTITRQWTQVRPMVCHAMSPYAFPLMSAHVYNFILISCPLLHRPISLN